MSYLTGTNLKEPSIIFIDLMNTIMFNHDRFGPNEPYLDTFQALGGTGLDTTSIHTIIDNAMSSIEADYEAQYSESQGSTVPDAHIRLRQEARILNRRLSLRDRIALSLTFAFHECGWIDRLHAQSIKKLASRYRLAIISNLWGSPYFCNLVLRRTGTLQYMEAVYYSSQIKLQKPWKNIFEHACTKHNVEAEDCLMIGDNIDLDILAATRWGMQGLWLSYGRDAGSRAQKLDAVALDFPDAVEILVPGES